MNIDEIRKGAPDGATHYRFARGCIEYLKKLKYHDTWYIYFDSRSEWITTFWNKVEIGGDIKPL